MRTITATEFKAKCLKLLDEVQRTGEELLVSKGFRQIFIVEDMCAAPWTAKACCSSGPCSPAARPTAMAREIPQNAAKPWLALRDGRTFIGDPFEPIVSESEIESPK